jgi:hypothetical protein
MDSIGVGMVVAEDVVVTGVDDSEVVLGYEVVLDERK